MSRQDYRKRLQQERIKRQTNKIQELIDRFKSGRLNPKRGKLKNHYPFCHQKLEIVDFFWDDHGALNVKFKDCTKHMKFFCSTAVNGGKVSNSYSLGNQSPEDQKQHIVEQLANHKNMISNRFGEHDEYVKNMATDNQFKAANGRQMYEEAYMLNIAPLSVAFVDTPTGTKVATCYIIAYANNNWNIFYSDSCDLKCRRTKYGNKIELIEEFNRLKIVTKDNLDTICQNLGHMATGGSLYDHTFQTLHLSRMETLDGPETRQQVKLQDTDDDELAIKSINLTQSFLESKSGAPDKASGSA